MKKNIQKYNLNYTAIEQYIYYIFDFTDDENIPETNIEKLTLFNKYFSDYWNVPYNKRYYNYDIVLCAENYLRGLPTGVSIDYWNDDISKLHTTFCNTNKHIDSFINDFFYIVANSIIYLLRKNKLL